MTFEKGKAYTIYDSSIGDRRKIHIVELIENEMIVYKYYGKYKQWWHYQVKSKDEIEFMVEQLKKFTTTKGKSKKAPM